MPLFRLLLVLFIAIPLIEIYLLIQVGGIIGAWPTVFLVVATAVIGVGLLRLQGLSTMMRAREAMARGELPALTMLEGVALIVAGALLLTPGFFTDTIGFLLLVPPVRQGLLKALLLRGVFPTPQDTSSTSTPPSSKDPYTIEGEFERKDDDPRS